MCSKGKGDGRPNESKCREQARRMFEGSTFWATVKVKPYGLLVIGGLKLPHKSKWGACAATTEPRTGDWYQRVQGEAEVEADHEQSAQDACDKPHLAPVADAQEPEAQGCPLGHNER